LRVKGWRLKGVEKLDLTISDIFINLVAIMKLNESQKTELSKTMFDVGKLCLAFLSLTNPVIPVKIVSGLGLSVLAFGLALWLKRDNNNKRGA